MMKKLLTIATLAALSGTAMAADNSPYGLSFSGSAALTTDYRYRGVTQTDTSPAVQGAFTLAHDSGVYFSTFASNVKNTGSLELDPAIGYSKDLGFGVLDVGVLYYGYPNDEADANWFEYYGKLTFSDLAVKGDSLLTNVNYTREFGGTGGDVAWYLNAAYSIPFGETGFGGVASLGYTTADDPIGYVGDKKNYVDWKVGVNYSSKSIEGLTAELAAVGTNADTDGWTDEKKRGVETGAVFTVTKAF